MIFEYKLKNGLLLCTVDIDNKDNPITFSKHFPSFQECKIIKKSKKKEIKQEVIENGDIK